MKLSAVAALLLASLPSALRAQENNSDLNLVMVTASRSPEPIADAIASVTVITRADIDRLQPQSVADLLTGLAGISMSSNGDLGKATSVYVRGTNSDHVLVLIDGDQDRVGNPGRRVLGAAAGGADRSHRDRARAALESLRLRSDRWRGADLHTPWNARCARMSRRSAERRKSWDVSDRSGLFRERGRGWYNASVSGLYTNGIPICVANAPVTAVAIRPRRTKATGAPRPP